LWFGISNLSAMRVFPGHKQLKFAGLLLFPHLLKRSMPGTLLTEGFGFFINIRRIRYLHLSIESNLPVYKFEGIGFESIIRVF